MNAPLNVLEHTVRSQAEEPAKYRLNPSNAAYAAPYIEHWVVQLHGVSPERIDDTRLLDATLNQAVDDLELTRVDSHSHYFGPGVSSVIILSESHLSAHTWPELGYVHLDIVTCVRKLTAERLYQVIARTFAPEHVQLDQIEY